MNTKNFSKCLVILLVIGIAPVAFGQGSGTLTIDPGTNSPGITNDVWEGTHSNHYLFTAGNGLGGVQTWNTDTWPSRGTALVGSTNLFSTGDATAQFTNWIDFSATIGSGTGLQYTEASGGQISFEHNAGRHQGYAMTESFVLAANAGSVSGTYFLENYTELAKGAGPVAYHDNLITGDASATLRLKGWEHGAVRSQGLQFDSNGGWGPTGQPSATATGNGYFMSEVMGSTYAMFGSTTGAGITPIIVAGGGGTITTDSTFFGGGFTATNYAVKANGGGI